MNVASFLIRAMSTSPSRVRVERRSDGGIGRMLARRQGHPRTDQGRKPPPDDQTLEEVEGNEGHEVRVVRYEGRKMDFYCRTFLVSPAPSLLTDSPAPDTVALTTHSHSELSFLVSYVDVPSSSDREKPSL